MNRAEMLRRLKAGGNPLKDLQKALEQKALSLEDIITYVNSTLNEWHRRQAWKEKWILKVDVEKLFSAFLKDNEKREKALLFVEHIENHLNEARETAARGFKYQLYGEPKVICKICGKTIDQIAELEASEEAV